MSTSTYTVVGMTCGHCVNAVTEEVSAVPGVTDVDVDLASGGHTVTSDAPVDEAVDVTLETGEVAVTSTAPLEAGAVETAVSEAGYTLVR